MKWTAGVVVLIFAVVSCSRALDYSDLEFLGKTCPGRDSCLQRVRGANLTDRNCECDLTCSAFSDCCIDVQAPVTSRRSKNSRLHCMSYGNVSYVGAYVVDNCPRHYAGPAELRSKCEDQEDFSDPLASVPVTYTSAGVTFRNRYCAECNNAPPSALQSWLIFLKCDSLSHLNDSFVWRNLIYRADIKTWGVEFQRHFHYCDIVFDKPDYVTAGVRLCRTNVTSICSPSWRRKTIERACASYMAVVYGANGVTYRNVHCAICNRQPITSLFCENTAASSRVKKPFSFALLIDINQKDGDVVGEKQKCPSGQIFDPFFEKCRTLVCAIPGFKLVDGKCKKP